MTTNSHDRFDFELTDSLGTVSIALPPGTDSFFSWIQRSDCGRPCESSDYRFQSKRNRVFKESGFFWTGEPEDSVDQLSIYHNHPYTFSKDDDSLILKRRSSLKLTVLADITITGKLVSDTLLRIGDRYFCVFRVADFNNKTKVHDRRLIAYTSVRGTILEFHYKLLTKINDEKLRDFPDRSMENLATVRIK